MDSRILEREEGKEEGREGGREKERKRAGEKCFHDQKIYMFAVYCENSTLLLKRKNIDFHISLPPILNNTLVLANSFHFSTFCFPRTVLLREAVATTTVLSLLPEARSPGLLPNCQSCVSPMAATFVLGKAASWLLASQ